MVDNKLLQRFDAILQRLAHLELAQRQIEVLQRLNAIESVMSPPPAATAATVAAATATATASASADCGLVPAIVTAVDPSGNAVQQRLQAELLQRGMARHRFVRAPPEYYERPLEFRRTVVGAASVDHLCKTIIMVNTRAHSSGNFLSAWCDVTRGG